MSFSLFSRILKGNAFADGGRFNGSDPYDMLLLYRFICLFLLLSVAGCGPVIVLPMILDR